MIFLQKATLCVKITASRAFLIILVKKFAQILNKFGTDRAGLGPDPAVCRDLGPGPIRKFSK